MSMLSEREALSRASHELRTPLNAILGFGQLLALDPLSDAQRHSVEQIIAGGRHLLSLVEDLLDLSAVRDLSVCPVELTEEIAHVVALCRPLAAERSLTMHVEHPDPTDPALAADADPRRLKQILLNLISNAVKYNRPGGSLTISAQPDGDEHVSITVTDTGRGLTEAELACLFVPFERLGAASRGIEGNGLGLALSRALAEAMGGTIEVDSTPGEGSSFTLRLPASVHPTSPCRATDRQLAGVA